MLLSLASPGVQGALAVQAKGRKTLHLFLVQRQAKGKSDFDEGGGFLGRLLDKRGEDGGDVYSSGCAQDISNLMRVDEEV